MKGLHIISDLYDIDFSSFVLDEDKMRLLLNKKIRKVGLSPLGEYFHTFSTKNEITGVLALGESHISIHTWPEYDYISLDIFVCNVENDNSLKAKELYEEIKKIFLPGRVVEKFIDRGI